MTLLSFVVSPSGKLYGSEQVLCDYLTSSSLEHKVLVNGKDSLYENLLPTTPHLSCFVNVKLLYGKIFFLCLLGKVKSVYINEAGHSKYIQILSQLFPSVRFIIHVRILEDTGKERWRKQLSKNVSVLSISNFIQSQLPVPSRLVYDPYPFCDSSIPKQQRVQNFLRVGIIGRISESKGISNILQVLRIIEENACADLFCFHFFGEMTNDIIISGAADELKKFRNIVFEGFVADKEDIYSRIDCVLHGAENEPLGRIFLEAIDKEIPFLGINKGGIGEIGSLVGLEDMLVECEPENIGQQLYEKLLQVRNNYQVAVQSMAIARNKAKEIFNLANYTRSVDSIMFGKEA